MACEDFTFRDLVSPMSAEDFFADCYGKSAVHIPGPEDKFRDVFSWEAFNRLINQGALWSNRTLKMALDGRNLDGAEYCTPGLNRDDQRVMRPDPERVHTHLQQGATLVLDLIETLSPGIAAVGGMLEVVLGAPLSCNAYCSWEQRQGFGSHFDTMDVFALHVEGTKTWRIYDGRFEQAAEISGYNYPSFPPDYHERAKGKLLKEVVMTPGDLLYLPRGQYHDALASSEACLHLSFGITHAIGQDLITMVARSLPDDPLFREALPHFDEAEAHEIHLRKIAARVGEIIRRPETSLEMREYQRRRAVRCPPAYDLPGRKPVARYRVRFLGASVTAHLGIWTLKTDAGEATLSPEEAEVAQWVLARDWFDRKRLSEAFEPLGDAALGATLDKLDEARLIAPF